MLVVLLNIVCEPAHGIFINHSVGDDYMSNMDLPPSSSDEDEADEDCEDGSESDAHAQPEHQSAVQCDDVSASGSRLQSQYAGSSSGETSSAEEGCSRSEVLPGGDHRGLPALQESSESTAQAEPGGNVAQGHGSNSGLSGERHVHNGILPVERQIQDDSSNDQDRHAVSLETLLKHTQLT